MPVRAQRGLHRRIPEQTPTLVLRLAGYLDEDALQGVYTRGASLHRGEGIADILVTGSLLAPLRLPAFPNTPERQPLFLLTRIFSRMSNRPETNLCDSVNGGQALSTDASSVHREGCLVIRLG